MALLKTDTYNIFDLSEIKVGDLISVNRLNEPDWKNGFVARVTEYEIIVTLADGMGGCCFVALEVEDVFTGLWNIRWSNDHLETAQKYEAEPIV